MVTIQWSDGSRTSAATWAELLERVAAIQWHPYTVEQMRHVLAKRAWRWSGVSVSADDEARAFWYALAKAKLVIIEKDDEETS